MELLRKTKTVVDEEDLHLKRNQIQVLTLTRRLTKKMG